LDQSIVIRPVSESDAAFSKYFKLDLLGPFLEISDVLPIYVIPADTPNIALPSASPVQFKPSGNPIICRFTAGLLDGVWVR